jgi:hypothetical protein
MRKISFFAGVVAVLVLVGVGTWIGVGKGTTAAHPRNREKAAQLVGTNAIWMAARLLRELAAEGKA